MLVNNAGSASVAQLLNADADAMEAMIALNVTALTRLTYAVAPAFVARGKGTIINIASIVAIGPERLNGVYGASKAYVLAFSHSLQHELADKGVRIQAVLPGATATALWESAGLPYQNLPPEIVMSAADMVDAALAGLDQGERVTIRHCTTVTSGPGSRRSGRRRRSASAIVYRHRDTQPTRLARTAGRCGCAAKPAISAAKPSRS